MGTYTDLLKLNRPPLPPTQGQAPLPPAPPAAPSEQTLWENQDSRKTTERPIAESPNGENAETPDRPTAKSPNSRTPKRRSVRHGIDIYKDQLVSLNKLQFALWRRDDRKPTMRELILTALDEFIERKRQELQEK